MQIFQEIKFAIRSLRKRGGFTLVTIVVLALGIGANTAIFSVVDAVLLRPLPFEDPDRIVQVWHVPPQKSFPGRTKFAVSPANFLDWQSQNSVFESMAMFHGGDFTITGNGQPQNLNGWGVTSDFFSVLHAKPLLGRLFTHEDERSDAGHLVVISEQLWRTNFGSSRNVIGQTIRFSDEPYTIIGVLPSSQTFPLYTPLAQVWSCLQWDAKERAVRGNHNYLAIARLKPGITLDQANSQLGTIAHQLALQYPQDDAGWGARAVPLHEELIGDVRPALLILLGAVGFVLLIACANVANLVLAATLARRKELAIRTALGASRADLVRQVLLETTLLAIIGGALGLVFSHFGVRIIVNYLADQLPPTEISLNLPVLLFTLGISILTGVLAGIIPAWRFTNANTNEDLKQGLGRAGADGGRRTRNVLVVAEVALSLMLLVGAGLTIRTLYHLQNTEIGVDPNNVITMSVQLPKSKYPTRPQQANFFNELQQKVSAIPGIQSASLIDSLPLHGGSTQPIMIEGRPLLQMADQPEVPTRRISTDYLKTMRIPVIRGRGFEASDTDNSTPVMLISQSLAREFFPNEDPIGKHISMELTDKDLELPTTQREIVGIVGDVKMVGLDRNDAMSAVYLPISQVRGTYMTIVARTSTAPTSVVSAIGNAIHSIDPDRAYDNLATMPEVIATSIVQRRFTMTLLVAFAGLALVLAAVGIYSVLSYAVRRRVREIGIRMALGAQIRDVMQMIVIDGMTPTVAGVAIGFVGALALGRVLSSVVFGVSPHDTVTFASVSVLLLMVALMASAIPAYRAAQVEPVKTLRDE